jgi:hypothetical protein
LQAAFEDETPKSSDVDKHKNPRRLKGVKRGFTTRRVRFESDLQLLASASPRSGDLLFAKVVSLGHHQKLESTHGRRAQLYPGDTILVAYGARYAPDQFEAVVPGDLDQCDLVAGGGVAGKVVNRHASVGPPTPIRPLGLLAYRTGQPLNLRHFALADAALPSRRPRVIAVAGTSMNSGKTTTAAGLIHGLSRAGLRVAAAKLTGTGSGNDYWSMVDAGAQKVFDFTDLGSSSTAGLRSEDVERASVSLIAHCAAERPDVIVLELADGLLQRETAALLASPVMRGAVDGVLFAARDAMGALGGRDWLQQHGYNVIAVSGLVSSSPLSSREAAEAMDTPVITLDELRDPVAAPTFAFAGNTKRVGLRACV